MNITDEQLLAASKAMFASNPQSKQWRDLSSCEKQIYLSQALEAAPLLQMPWEMPTRREEIECADLGQTYEQGMSGINHGAGILRVFVLRRNASLIPKPVDPRREKVFRTLMCNVAGPHDLQVVTDRILAALDAKE
jgi:hypothetical protein